MLDKNFKWTALFSHTGREVYNISKQLGRYPDKIITNNSPDADIYRKIRNKNITYTKTTPEPEDYVALLENDHIITLHGWMRIVPEVVCHEYNIFNLHPGLITLYPELKGKDPQKRVATELNENKYSKIGCVIHRVTPGVDEGEILAENSTHNVYSGESVITEKLHEMALALWVDFFDYNLNNPNNDIL